MKSVYATLNSYNQYMEDTNGALLQCPELSTYGMDQGEEDYSLSEDGTSSTVYLDADVEGSHLDPPVSTKASSTITGMVHPDGLSLLVKVRHLRSVTRVSLHAIEDDAIGQEVVVMYARERPSSTPFTGTLLSRRFYFREFNPSITHDTFLDLLENEKWGLVVYTVEHPDGEMSGFLHETLFT